MAVEARYLNLSPPQMLRNRDVTLNGCEDMNNLNGSGMIFPGLSPMNGTAATAGDMMLPMYGAAVMDFVSPTLKNGTMKADSGLTYSNIPVVSRKRSREDSNNSMNQLGSYPTGLQNQNICGGNNHSSTGQFTFLGQDISSQIQRQQLEVDSLIAHHTDKLRLEIGERQKSYSRKIIAAVGDRMMKKLKAKDDEFQKIVKLNWALEERVKSLCLENQIFRDLAQASEAAANVLRNNLEQVLAQVQNPEFEAGLVDDAESCCASNENELIQRRKVAENAEAEISSCWIDNVGDRLCKRCGKDEACVLLLPCRHLCLCSVCGLSQNVCPICKSTKNCSLHVNRSS